VGRRRPATLYPSTRDAFGGMICWRALAATARSWSGPGRSGRGTRPSCQSRWGHQLHDAHLRGARVCLHCESQGDISAIRPRSPVRGRRHRNRAKATLSAIRRRSPRPWPPSPRH